MLDAITQRTINAMIREQEEWIISASIPLSERVKPKPTPKTKPLTIEHLKETLGKIPKYSGEEFNEMLNVELQKQSYLREKDRTCIETLQARVVRVMRLAKRIRASRVVIIRSRDKHREEIASLRDKMLKLEKQNSDLQHKVNNLTWQICWLKAPWWYKLLDRWARKA